MAKKQQNVFRKKITDTEKELTRFENALETAKQQLAQLHDKATTEVGEANAAIFEIHQMMLEDDDYLDSIRNIISEQQVAELADKSSSVGELLICLICTGKVHGLKSSVQVYGFCTKCRVHSLFSYIFIN